MEAGNVMAGSSVYRVVYETGARKALLKMDKSQYGYIMAWITKNLIDTGNPRQHGKALKGNLSGYWRYRLGPYRLIERIQDGVLLILMIEIGHRREAYDG